MKKQYVFIILASTILSNLSFSLVNSFIDFLVIFISFLIDLSLLV